MLIRIGTHKYHFFLGLFYYCGNGVINFLELGFTYGRILIINNFKPFFHLRNYVGGNK